MKTQNFSLHMHTIGFDGQNTEEQMLEQARLLGWEKIGFSNHFIVNKNIKKIKFIKKNSKILILEKNWNSY